MPLRSAEPGSLHGYFWIPAVTSESSKFPCVPFITRARGTVHQNLLELRKSKTTFPRATENPGAPKSRRTAGPLWTLRSAEPGWSSGWVLAVGIRGVRQGGGGACLGGVAEGDETEMGREVSAPSTRISDFCSFLGKISHALCLPGLLCGGSSVWGRGVCRFAGKQQPPVTTQLSVLLKGDLAETHCCFACLKCI